MPISQIVTNSIASGQTITSPVIAGTPTGVGVLTLGTAVASTSGTSIDFTSIPSWVKRITVNFNGVSTNGASNYLIQLGTSGTPTTSGYSAVSSIVYNTGFGTASSTAGFILYASAAVYAFYGSQVITITSGNTWETQGVIANTATTPFTTISAGGVTLGGVLNMVRITTANGTDTFDAGTINILYE